jgi:transposase-like protein
MVRAARLAHAGEKSIGAVLTNAIESLNSRYRRAVKARGHFRFEQAAIKCLYLVTGEDVERVAELERV